MDRGRVVASGPLETLLGDAAVRIRVTGLPAEARVRLAAFGPVRDDGEWLHVRPIAPERIPDLVAAIVAAGGRVHAVEPGRESLEERFVALMSEST